jgi:hypothetical protein
VGCCSLSVPVRKAAAQTMTADASAQSRR